MCRLIVSRDKVLYTEGSFLGKFDVSCDEVNKVESSQEMQQLIYISNQS